MAARGGRYQRQPELVRGPRESVGHDEAFWRRHHLVRARVRVRVRDRVRVRVRVRVSPNPNPKTLTLTLTLTWRSVSQPGTSVVAGGKGMTTSLPGWHRGRVRVTG